LDEYYFMLRYPGMGDEVPFKLCTNEDAKEGLEKTKEIIEKVMEKFK